MEYLSINGCLRFSNCEKATDVENKFIHQMNKIEFVYVDDNACEIESVNDNFYFKIEGLIDEDEGNKIIDMMNDVKEYIDNKCFININRARWELYIDLNNYSQLPSVANL